MFNSERDGDGDDDDDAVNERLPLVEPPDVADGWGVDLRLLMREERRLSEATGVCMATDGENEVTFCCDGATTFSTEG